MNLIVNILEVWALAVVVLGLILFIETLRERD